MAQADRLYLDDPQLRLAFEGKSPALALAQVRGHAGGEGPPVVEATVTLSRTNVATPDAQFRQGRHRAAFPELVAGRHDHPAVHELVQLKSRDVHVSPIWKGARPPVLRSSLPRAAELRPVKVGAGYRFSWPMTVDDLLVPCATFAASERLFPRRPAAGAIRL